MKQFAILVVALLVVVAVITGAWWLKIKAQRWYLGVNTAEARIAAVEATVTRLDAEVAALRAAVAARVDAVEPKTTKPRRP